MDCQPLVLMCLSDAMVSLLPINLSHIHVVSVNSKSAMVVVDALTSEMDHGLNLQPGNGILHQTVLTQNPGLFPACGFCTECNQNEVSF